MFTEEQINQNKSILKKIFALMEEEDITVTQAEKIIEMLPYEFKKNSRLFG